MSSFDWEEPKQEVKIDTVAIDFAKCFHGQGGKEVLEYLTKYFLEYPVANPGENSNWAYFREGQNDIVRRIKSLIIKGEKLNDRK
jgi:hypothetical protein